MRRILRVWSAAAAAVVTLLCCAASASAVSGVTIRPGGEFTAVGIIDTTVLVTHCNVTLRGTFATSLVGIGGLTQVGSITGFTTAGCSPVTITALELPWAIKSRTVNAEEARYVPAEAVEYFLSEVTASFGMGLCLARGRFELANILRAAGGTAYTAIETVGFGLLPATCFGEPAESIGIEMTTGAPRPTQTMTFLNGGTEVITGPSPNPLDFGTVRPSEPVQRTVTIGSLRGGRIEEIAVTTGRYFAITDPNGCGGRTLGMHGTCRITAILSPPAETGTAVSDTLTVRLAGVRYTSTLRGRT